MILNFFHYMTQIEVYEFLKKNKSKWYTSNDIRDALGTASSSISTNLKRLRGHKAVLFKMCPKKGNTYLYKVR